MKTDNHKMRWRFKFLDDVEFSDCCRPLAIGLVLFFGVTVPISASCSDDENQRLGYCIAIFGAAMNAYALSNNTGGVKLMSLHFGRTYVAYAALNINGGGKARADAINREISKYAQDLSGYIRSHPELALSEEVDKCTAFVGPIFSKLAIDGVKLDPAHSDTVVDTAAAMAAAVRKDLGY